MDNGGCLLAGFFFFTILWVLGARRWLTDSIQLLGFRRTLGDVMSELTCVRQWR